MFQIYFNKKIVINIKIKVKFIIIVKSLKNVQKHLKIIKITL